MTYDPFEEETEEKEIKEKSKENDFEEDELKGQSSFGRVRLPKEKEIIGIIEQRLGGNKMMVLCTDGKSRNCRVPGRLKRELWLRPNDVVLVEPWELDNTRGDVIFKYKPTQIIWLKKNGYLKNEKEEF